MGRLAPVAGLGPQGSPARLSKVPETLALNGGTVLRADATNRKKINMVLLLLQCFCADIIGGALVVGIINLPKLPVRLPTHYDIGGQPDAFRSAAFVVVFYPVLALVLHVLLSLPAWLDRKASERRFFYLVPWLAVQLGVMVLVLFGEAMAILHGLGRATTVSFLPAVGFLLLLLGLVLPTFPPEVLSRVRGGKRASGVLLGAGLVTAVGFFMPVLAPWLLVASLLAVGGLLTLWRRAPKPVSGSGSEGGQP